MDPPDVDGFMKRFGYALKRKVLMEGCGHVEREYVSGEEPDPDTLICAYLHDKTIGALLNANSGDNMCDLALVGVFVEWMSGGAKSKAAREFVINTCRTALAAGM